MQECWLLPALDHQGDAQNGEEHDDADDEVLDVTPHVQKVREEGRDFGRDGGMCRGGDESDAHEDASDFGQLVHFVLCLCYATWAECL